MNYSTNKNSIAVLAVVKHCGRSTAHVSCCVHTAEIDVHTAVYSFSMDFLLKFHNMGLAALNVLFTTLRRSSNIVCLYSEIIIMQLLVNAVSKQIPAVAMPDY